MKDETYNSYKALVINYIEDGTLPEGVKTYSLINLIKDLDRGQKGDLIYAISERKPKCSWSYITPAIDNIPNSLKWSVLAGSVCGLAQYQISENAMTASFYGLATGAVTFFGQYGYKRYQTAKHYEELCDRANDFLYILSPSNSYAY